jgi:hypothetical protein
MRGFPVQRALAKCLKGLIVSEVAGSWRRLLNEEIHNLHASQNIAEEDVFHG